MEWPARVLRRHSGEVSLSHHGLPGLDALSARLQPPLVGPQASTGVGRANKGGKIMAEEDSKSQDAQKRREHVVSVPFLIIALFISLILLVITFRSPQTPSFSQLGGRDRVETAVEVSRLWPKKHINIVVAPDRTTGDHNLQAGLMLRAGVYAAQHDAPLLLIPTNGPLPKAVKGLLKQREDACIYPFPNARFPQPRLSQLQQRNTQNSCNKELVSPTTNSRVSVISVDGPSREGWEPELPKTEGLQISRDAYFSSCYFRWLFGWLPWDPPRRILHCLPERLVLATQDKPDLPDAAVAIALAAHLNRVSNLKKGSEKAAVVMVPRYLEANRELEEKLRKRSRRVKEALVVGGSDVMTADLRSHLRGVVTARDPKNSWEAAQGTVGQASELALALAVIFSIAAVAERREGLWQAVRDPGQTMGHAWQAIRHPRQPIRRLFSPEERNEGKPQDPWIQLFNRPLPICVRVNLRNQREIFGLYGEDSIAVPGSRDLYLQRQLIAYSDEANRLRPEAQGIWLSGSEIVTLEFLDATDHGHYWLLPSQLLTVG